jgi:hypothetical protein
MTYAAIQMRRSGPRLQAIASIIRKDVRLFGWYAAAGTLVTFVCSAFVHVQSDFSPIALNFGGSILHVDAVLYGLCAIGVPLALLIFVVILVQADVATDMQRDWLVRPVAPLEIVAAKMAMILAVIAAPMIAGNLVYMMIKPMPAAEVFATLGPMLGGSIAMLVLSWLVSTPFRALLAAIGMIVLVALAVAVAIAIKFAVAVVLTGGSEVDVTPFPRANGDWITPLIRDVALYAVSGLTLWLLLARRRPAAARWLFVGYVTLSMFVQFLLFIRN